MNKTDDILRQLGWQRMTGNPNPDILWYVFTGRSDLNELDVSEMDDFPNRDIRMDCVVRLIRDPDADTPKELRPFWRLVYETNVGVGKEDSGLSFDELEAFYKKLKELIRKETRQNERNGRKRISAAENSGSGSRSQATQGYAPERKVTKSCDVPGRYR